MTRTPTELANHTANLNNLAKLCLEEVIFIADGCLKEDREIVLRTVIRRLQEQL